MIKNVQFSTPYGQQNQISFGKASEAKEIPYAIANALKAKGETVQFQFKKFYPIPIEGRADAPGFVSLTVLNNEKKPYSENGITLIGAGNTLKDAIINLGKAYKNMISPPKV